MDTAQLTFEQQKFLNWQSCYVSDLVLHFLRKTPLLDFVDREKFIVQTLQQVMREIESNIIDSENRASILEQCAFCYSSVDSKKSVF